MKKFDWDMAAGVFTALFGMWLAVSSVLAFAGAPQWTFWGTGISTLVAYVWWFFFGGSEE